MSLNRFPEAEPLIAKAVKLNQSSDVSFYNYGLISKQLNKPKQALEQFSQAIELNPKIAETWNNRGTVYNELAQYEAAISDFDQAISLNANYGEAYANKGKSLSALKRHDLALAAYDKALSIKTDLAEAWLGRGNVFTDLKRYDEALAACDKALSIKTDLAKAWLGRGNVFTDLKRYDEALAAYDKALSIKPDLIGVEGMRLNAKMHYCNWSNFHAEGDHLINTVRDGKPNTDPFVFLAITFSAEDQLRCAQIWTATQYPQAQSYSLFKHSKNATSKNKIKIGYLSADFHEHATSYLMAGLFEAHDKSKFEIIGLSVGPNDDSQLRHRVEQSFNSFINMSALSNDQIASEIYKLEIDVLIDLKGFTKDSRTGILRYRPSPIQVNYLGYPGTMGAEFIDYIIADRILIADRDRKFYREKIVSLPHTYQVNDRKRYITEESFTRDQCGLPQNDFVYCCFNNNYKITPWIFDSWMRILSRVDDSVIWLLEDNKTAAKNLRKEAQQRSIDASRLIFAERMPLADHLARHRLADLFLDTLPYNAHTTASDALWAGLPVLTQIGETFAGRVAASLLNAIDLPELITHSREEYEALAIELALNRDKLLNIKEKLNKNRLTTPLFDTALYTKHLEAAYEAMHRRYQTGLPPDHIEIQPIKNE